MKFTFHVLLDKSESPVVLLSIEFNFVELLFCKVKLSVNKHLAWLFVFIEIALFGVTRK